jgi:hypothetical protein
VTTPQVTQRFNPTSGDRRHLAMEHEQPPTDVVPHEDYRDGDDLGDRRADTQQINETPDESGV